jgi:hypothetical protein
MGRDDPHERKTPTRPFTAQEREQLRLEWEALEERKHALERAEADIQARWPEDVTRPNPIGTYPAIDWRQQPPIPAEKIDWSHNGTPIRVRLTLGAMLTLVTTLCTVLGGGAYMIAQARAHMVDAQAHLDPSSGTGWGAAARFESRAEAAKAHTDMVQSLGARMDKLRDEIVQALRRR